MPLLFSFLRAVFELVYLWLDPFIVCFDQDLFFRSELVHLHLGFECKLGLRREKSRKSEEIKNTSRIINAKITI